VKEKVNKKLKAPAFKNQKDRFSAAEKGLTLVEILVVLAILGAVSVALYSNFRNTALLRELEGSTRDIQMTLQRARFQAVRMRLNHRVSFSQENNIWYFAIEREDSPSVWNLIPGSIKKAIPKKFNVTVNIPGQAIIFSPLGFISNYSSSQNSISLQSAELERNKQPDIRVINVFAGGAIKYAKASSEGGGE
jgi:prepilin-type N-terminal cleavage/methylation domain-containing protein